MLKLVLVFAGWYRRVLACKSGLVCLAMGADTPIIFNGSMNE
jgi:hypothetical protein